MSDINVTVADATPISVTISGGVANNYVSEDTEFFFDGASGNTYIKYNSTTSKLEFWVDGVKKMQL